MTNNVNKSLEQAKIKKSFCKQLDSPCKETFKRARLPDWVALNLRKYIREINMDPIELVCYVQNCSFLRSNQRFQKARFIFLVTI
jgi:hypothetical protein